MQYKTRDLKFYEMSVPKVAKMTGLCLVIAAATFFTTYIFRLYPYEFTLDKNSFGQFYRYLNYAMEYTGRTRPTLTMLVGLPIGRGARTENETKEAEAVPILVYHGLTEDADGVNATADTFKNQLFALARAGYQTVSLDDYHAFIEGKKKLPPKSFLLTFDDGRKDSYYEADPILRALDYQAVMFIITKYSLEMKNHVYYLSAGELNAMEWSGRWDIEVHTKDGHTEYPIAADGAMGHFYSSLLWLPEENRNETPDEFRARIATDFEGAHKEVASSLHKSATGFAFPFGDFGQSNPAFPEAQQIVLQSMKPFYKLGFYQTWGGDGHSWNYANSHSFLAKRIEPEANWTSEDLLNAVKAGAPKSLPFEDTFAENLGWRSSWSRVEVTDGALTVGSDGSSTGATAFLDGTYNWRDYVVDVVIKSSKGRDALLLTRFVNNLNYAACDFSQNFVQIREYTNGVEKVLDAKTIPIPEKTDLRVQAKVQGNVMDCYIGDTLVATSDILSSVLDRGGIGFEAWDPTPGISETSVSKVVVTPL